MKRAYLSSRNDHVSCERCAVPPSYGGGGARRQRLEGWPEKRLGQKRPLLWPWCGCCYLVELAGLRVGSLQQR